MAELISESGLNVSDLEYAIAESKVLGNALTLDNLTDEPYLPDYDNIYLNVLHDTILLYSEKLITRFSKTDHYFD